MDGYDILAMDTTLSCEGGRIYPQATIYNDGQGNAATGELGEKGRRYNGYAHLNAPFCDKYESGKRRRTNQRQDEFTHKRASPQ